MRLFHGTSTRYLKKILEEGLTPRFQNGNDNWKGNTEPSRPFYVYLTRFWGYSLFYGEAACGDSDDEFPVIIEVEVDKKRLVHDEDAIKVGKQHVRNFMTDADGSLKVLGNAAYDGSIPKEDFVRIYIILDRFYSISFEKDGFNIIATMVEDAKTKEQKDADDWLLSEMIRKEGILVYMKPFDVDFGKIANKEGTLGMELGMRYRAMAYPQLFEADGTARKCKDNK